MKAIEDWALEGAGAEREERKRDQWKFLHLEAGRRRGALTGGQSVSRKVEAEPRKYHVMKTKKESFLKKKNG